MAQDKDPQQPKPGTPYAAREGFDSEGRDAGPSADQQQDYDHGRQDDTKGWDRTFDQRAKAEQNYGRGYSPNDSAGTRSAAENPGSFSGDRHGGWHRDRGAGSQQERGFLQRAGDKVSSWFADDATAKRQPMDNHRGKGPKGYTRSDDRIREDVSDRLSDDDGVDASHIEVAVLAGEVTLTGHVPTRQQRRLAEDCVERAAGVSHVQNNLRVGMAKAPTTPDSAGSPSAPGISTTTGTTS